MAPMTTPRFHVGDRVRIPGGGLGSDPYAVYTVAEALYRIGLSPTGRYRYRMAELSPSFWFCEDYLEPETPPAAWAQLALL